MANKHINHISNMKMCRICIRDDAKLYHYNGFELKNIYEEILNKKVKDDDVLPKYFCFECAAMLHKFHKFKTKCNISQKLFLSTIEKEVTSKSIKLLKTKGKKLQSHLGVITISKRVRCIKFKSKKEIEDNSNTELESKENLKEESDASDKDFKEIEIAIKDFHDSEDLKNEEKLHSDFVDNGNHHTASDDVFEEEKVDIGAEKDQLDIYSDNRGTSSDDEVLSNLKRKKKVNKVSAKCAKSAEKDDEEVEPDMKTKKKTKKERKGLWKRPEVKLQPQFWEIKKLTEQEAQTEFQMKAQQPKYLAAAYQCKDCFRGFSKQEMLTRHNKKTHDESLGPIVCKFCRTRFRIQCQLRRHLCQHYQLYRCLRCHLVCNRENSALLHEEHHLGVVKKCAHCGEEFTHPSTYYTHLRSHRSSFVCALCGQSFVSEMGLRYHRTNIHAELNEQGAKSAEEENTYCDKCNIRFETREAFDEHYAHSVMHADLFGEDDRGEQPAAPQAPVKGDKVCVRRPRLKVTCSNCQQLFLTRKSYDSHPCVVDGVVSERGGGAARGRGGVRVRGRGRGWVSITQRKRSPTTKPKLVCEICGASVGALYMEAHLNTHTRRRVYACDICGVKMYSQSSLIRHQLIHTGERPYKCPLCEKRFTQSNSMKLHYRTFHLKEPYPKRNRKPKEEAASVIDFSSLQTWSTDS